MDNWIFKAVPYFIGFVFVAIFTVWIISGVLIFKGVDVIQKDGVKTVIERIWNGQQ